ncbi:hypothetical protein ACHAW5_000240 [Stephanodiscus triporus]|uniref:Uncharacterized protein n=1 Tax=Stephanodiscus triporus TaxID=2934178 RepID=A0ABD3NHN2_9STRA
MIMEYMDGRIEEILAVDENDDVDSDYERIGLKRMKIEFGTSTRLPPRDGGDVDDFGPRRPTVGGEGQSEEGRGSRHLLRRAVLMAWA